ncbi:MAG: SAM-dependent methyltransferase, partial [Cyanobacteria bacterium P01_H01_bin.121]
MHSLAIPLPQRLATFIDQQPQQRITFADYMNWVLYDSEAGYYTKAERLGYGGDFVTALHLGSDFGELIAEQLLDMWHILGQPRPFTVVEMGAGQGQLAADILQYLHQADTQCLQSLQYWLIERSPAMRLAQQSRLSEWQTRGVELRWLAWQDLEAQSITGCLLSNELLDAMAVHRVCKCNGTLQEIYVTAQTTSQDTTQFVE